MKKLLVFLIILAIVVLGYVIFDKEQSRVQTNLVAPGTPVLTYQSSPPSPNPYIQITWNYNVANYFNVYRSTSPNGNWVKIISNYPQSGHAAADYGYPKDATVLYYRITSSDGKTSESSPSPASSVKITGSTAGQVSNWKTYASQKFSFTFKYPNGYTVKEESYGVQIYDSAKTDYYGNPIYLINFLVETTNKTLDSIMVAKAKEFSVSEVTLTTTNGLPSYEGVDLGMTTQYAVFFKNSSNLIEIQFRTSNSDPSSNEGLQKYKAALTDNQKLILSTFKFTK